MAGPISRMREALQCNVCQDTMTKPVQVSCPARHVFDQDCIAPWVAVHHNCPTCRGALPNDELVPDLLVQQIIDNLATLRAEPLEGERVFEIRQPGSIKIATIWNWFRTLIVSLWRRYSAPKMQIPLHYEFFRGQTLQIVEMRRGDEIVVPSNESLNMTASLIARFPENVKTKVEQAQRFTAVMTRMSLPNYIFAIDVPNPPFKADIYLGPDDAKGLGGVHFGAVSHPWSLKYFLSQL
jgi:hypothetical protein